jgi:hypothetical protein
MAKLRVRGRPRSQGLNARAPLKVPYDRTMGTNPVRMPLEQSGALGRPERYRARAASACPHAGAVSLTFADASAGEPRAGANEEPHRAPADGHNWHAMLVE